MRILAYPAFRDAGVNPYTRLLYESIRPLVEEIMEYRMTGFVAGHVDVLHVHWPDLILSDGGAMRAVARAAAFLARLAEYKARGARLVWTVHNLAPHDRSPRLLEARFWPAFLHLLDGLIFLSEPSRQEALAARPALVRLPCAVIPHGHYKPAIGTPMDRGEARRQLALPADRFLFLHFGQLRDYKNVPLLMQAFLALGRNDAGLVIAGHAPAHDGLRVLIEGIAAGRDDIHLDLRLIPEPTLLAYLAAADMVVLPYRRILNSGSALLALSAARPVIAPRTGSLAALADQVGPRWLRAYTGAFHGSLLREAITQPVPVGAAPDLSPYDWDRIAVQTVAFYQRLRRQPRRAAA